MQARYALIQKLPRLVDGPLHADAGYFLIALACVDASHQPRRVARPLRQVGNAFEAPSGENRHEAGNDRHGDTNMRAPIPEVQEVAVVEEELGTHVVRTFLHLLLEVGELLQAVGRVGMSLRKPGHADTEAALVRMLPPAVEGDDVPHQVDGVGEIGTRALFRSPVFGRIAAESHDVAYTVARVRVQDLVDLVLCVADTG